MRESLFAHTLRVNTYRSKRVTKYITCQHPIRILSPVCDEKRYQKILTFSDVTFGLNSILFLANNTKALINSDSKNENDTVE